VKPGETFVWGRSSDMARALLAAAEAAGQPPHVVKATIHGYVIPDAVWEHVTEVPEAAF
jgi:hypothetical protein